MKSENVVECGGLVVVLGLRFVAAAPVRLALMRVRVVLLRCMVASVVQGCTKRPHNLMKA